MVTPVKITQSSVALKIPATSELVEGGLAVNVVDGALYSARHDGSVIRIEGDTGNGTIASASSIALGAVMAAVVDVTGTTTITAIVLREGQTRTVRFTGALNLTNSSTLVLLGGFNIVTVAGDFATFRGYSGGITRCINYAFSPTNIVTLAGVQTLTNKTLTAPVIDVINNTPIGGTTPAAGAFTSLSTTGAANIALGGVASLNLGNAAAYCAIASGGYGATVYMNGSTRGGAGTAASGVVVVATDGSVYFTNAAVNTNRMVISSAGVTVANSLTIGSFTVATRPAHAAGKIIYVSDGGAGSVFQGSNGTAWVNLG